MRILSLVGFLLAVSLSIEGFLISKCPEGDRKSLKGQCNKYLECLNNAWHEKQCSDNAHSFDVRTKTCRDRKEVRCEKTCDKGQTFNQDKNECENEADKTISLDLQRGEECVNGSIEPVPGSCSQYYRCDNGKKVEEKCWFFERFNLEILNCDYIWHANCKSGTECKSGDKVPSGNCREYYQCEYGYWKKRYCGTSIGLPMYFDERSKDCMIVGSKCSSIECSIEGLQTDLPTDCSKYRVCHKGRFHEKSCGWFQKYDSERNECRYVGVDCTKAQNLPDCADGARKSVDGSCYSYEECVDGHFSKRFCLYPLYKFDKSSHSCIFMGTCNEQCYEREVIPAARCDQFYICNKGNYELQTCARGNAFDVVTLSCTNPKYATCNSLNTTSIPTSEK